MAFMLLIEMIHRFRVMTSETKIFGLRTMLGDKAQRHEVTLCTAAYVYHVVICAGAVSAGSAGSAV